MKIPYIDDLLNQITMYKLTLYYLIFLVISAILLGLFNIISISPVDILLSLIVVVGVCYVSNYIFAKMFKATTNVESVFITALILLLIIPVKFPQNLTFFALASVFAMGIKYLPTINKRHIFNPAAASVAAISLISLEHSATWWVGTPAMLPFVLLGGLLLVRRIRREYMVLVFLISYVLLIGISTLFHGASFSSLFLTWQRGLLNSAVLFFSFVMLTEPLTSPPTKKLQGYFSTIVALLYSTPQLRLFGIVFTPEMALSFGNIYSFIVSPKYRLALKLKEKIIVAHNTIVFNFGKQEKFAFDPGQYLEWTLPHKKVDSRGNRRYFSISSSVDEELQMVVRFHENPSSYKNKLIGMQPGDEIIATSLAGDFVLPKNLSEPLVFVAGGIGVAPFRSMIQFIIDKKLKVNLILLYSNRNYNEIAFSDLFQKANEFGVKTYYTLTDKNNLPVGWNGEVGHFTPELISKLIPDYTNRIYYVSGPQIMVQGLEKTLSTLGVGKNKIKTDYFPGFKDK